MKIEKNLKYASFDWDDDKKEFTIDTTNSPEGSVISLNKVYSFAFMRFVIRMAQRNWFKKVAKEKEAQEGSLSVLDEEVMMQLAFSLEEDNENCSELPKEKLEELVAGVRNEYQRGDEDLPF